MVKRYTGAQKGSGNYTARVKTFYLDIQSKGVPDVAIAAFITECEEQHYVSVVTQFIPVPTPRLTVIVTKLDEKDVSVEAFNAIR